MFDITRYADASQSIIDAGRFLYQNGWSPATSSNYSARIDEQHIAITVSGKHKGALTNADVMVVNLAGEPVQSSCRSSAETLLHTVIYDLFSDIGAVLHTHSMPATVLSRWLEGENELCLTDYELQKAFPGYESHESQLVIPIFENTQDIEALAAETKAYFNQNPDLPGYLIRGHGLYTWGKTMADCLRHVEAFEFLLQCELEMKRLP
ncbi:methylthioribulose 1-phosphate dehydratase [Alkalimarinus sediminis]|uniref:Methylthioribulose-1-phosphate dehydratase n=1 Tax=Alkalimarinus sediminis TaxID=1632866 RepID=A0A9E8HJ24_9ALTE|nr:methylthioribulose 1-phosphate dehydratase [Alkalimarinus sediminis]UZW75598.1 methylthioribulose 1-phosphate dehydratase [Alkalimarinus sediminis]